MVFLLYTNLNLFKLYGKDIKLKQILRIRLDNCVNHLLMNESKRSFVNII